MIPEEYQEKNHLIWDVQIQKAYIIVGILGSCTPWEFRPRSSSSDPGIRRFQARCSRQKPADRPLLRSWG